MIGPTAVRNVTADRVKLKSLVAPTSRVLLLCIFRSAALRKDTCEIPLVAKLQLIKTLARFLGPPLVPHLQEAVLLRVAVASLLVL